MTARVARRITVHGHVQGVFFRASVRDAARRAGAAGWAENQPDGTVEIHAEGSHEAVDAVEAFCRKGPRGAQVERVDMRPVEPEDLTVFVTR